MKIFTKTCISIGTLALLLCSCTSVSEEDLIDPPVASVLTFQDDILPITSDICAQCHTDPPINGAPMPLVTYENIVDAIENRGLLNRINSASAPMPPSGLLPAPTRAIVQQWVDEGLLEQ